MQATNESGIAGKQLHELVGNYVVFKYPDPKPLFENNRKIVQKFSLFPYTGGFVLDWQRAREDYMVQVVFPLESNWDYNHYIVLFYDWPKESMTMMVYPSQTIYPPVWDRAFSCGPDWFDYVAIQKYIKPFVDKRGYEFTIDEAIAGKAFNGTKETPEEIRQLIRDGKSYSVVSLKMEVMVENMTLKSVEKVAAE